MDAAQRHKRDVNCLMVKRNIYNAGRGRFRYRHEYSDAMNMDELSYKMTSRRTMAERSGICMAKYHNAGYFYPQRTGIVVSRSNASNSSVYCYYEWTLQTYFSIFLFSMSQNRKRNAFRPLLYYKLFVLKLERLWRLATHVSAVEKYAVSMLSQ